MSNKLRCVEHDKRVHALKDGEFIHQDATACRSFFATAGNRTFTPFGVITNTPVSNGN